jgi:hypothetical protein
MQRQQRSANWNELIYIDHVQMLRAKGETKLASQLLESQDNERNGQSCEETLFLNPASSLLEDEDDDEINEPLNERVIFSKAYKIEK